ncbi:MAG: outer membrane lipoprotein LolB [Gammaproteobacteria bacterium]|nr:outer membrane lipoprotein LolB [Rhodocyclaceae bacterium]MBU3988331.1 outer membrane lipoprotein LolB [Gammaproteobacteria bacterium]MBU4005680.1 outer membrane lipoprotein LolB [Gammaproteobacteria bacterium]MBU4020767.1 outer membrane lipoprotein LolB [Gammaproteobacteria bacterium]MBU4096586.1 outer membrane lipoprotein LolB [Gammaproteobacteria bacterium]
MIRTILGWALALAILSGCASAPQFPARPPAAQIEQFAFSGRIAVRQGEVRHNARVDWRHATGRDEILLTTPFGQGVAELTRDASGARLVLADQRRFVADDWSTLAQQVFGFPLPLGTSARWLLGDVADTEGWRVTIVERESAAVDALPTVFELERDDIAVRLKIDEWIEVK